MTERSASDGKRRPLVTLDGRYHVIERIAAGGMGEVFRAHDAVLAREVAIKVLHRSLATDPAFVERFRREARSAASLSHPNIVGVHDWGAVDGIYYMVMEFVDGASLREILNVRGKLEPLQAAEVTRQVLLALAEAGRVGIVHRDIKPENILITAAGLVKVADFGLARAYADTTRSQSDAVTGTAQYLAPELIRGEPADPRSDLYSLGIVTYEMLTGRLPFTGETSMAIAYKHVSDRVPAPSATAPDLPAQLDGFVASATERERELRPENAAAMLTDLQAIRSALVPAPKLASLVKQARSESNEGDLSQATDVFGTLATEQMTPDPPMRRRDRSWGRTALVLALILGLLAAGGYSGWYFLIPKKAAVPDVTGTTKAEARTQLEDMGLVVDVGKAEYSRDFKADQIIRVIPPEGTILAKGQEVTIVPSLGMPFTTVPNLVGMTLEEAAASLTDAGLTLGGRTEVYSMDVPAGRIIRQALTDKQREGTAVAVELSRGKPPVKIPATVGKTKSEATALLTGAGFDVVTATVFSNTVAKGVVISSSPGAGATITYGSKVTLTVSKGPQSFPCPNFVGMSTSQANVAAQAAGLRVSLVPVPGATGTRVVSQLPGAGATVRYGEIVALYYA